MSQKQNMDTHIPIAAVITTIRPDDSLVINLKRIAFQVGIVILVDDMGGDAVKDLPYFADIQNFQYIKNKTNIGIAASLNIGVASAAEQGFDWVITLDDDTLVSDTYVRDIFEFIQRGELPEVGLVACLRNDGWQSCVKNEAEYLIKRTLITSGSVFSIDTFTRVGGFDEGMFIDLVDFDFCTKIRKIGRSIALLNKAGMEHKVGNSRVMKFVLLRFVIYNHAPFRLYYQMRNIFFFVKKHFAFDPLLSTYLFLDLFRLPLKALLFESAKLKRLSYMGAGLLDGLRGRCGRVRLNLK